MWKLRLVSTEMFVHLLVHTHTSRGRGEGNNYFANMRMLTDLPIVKWQRERERKRERERETDRDRETDRSQSTG